MGSASVRVNGRPFQYEATAEAGVMLSTGDRWWGTRLRWRPGTSGRWHTNVLLDVHPFDVEAVERGLVAWIANSAELRAATGRSR